MILDNAALHHNRQTETRGRFEAEFTKVATAGAAIKRGKFGRYAHDKVMVVSDARGAKKVLTGSTNFSVSGLYVNSNHMLVFGDAATAEHYAALFEQVWEEGVKAGAFIKSALAGERFSPPGTAVPPRTITFSPHSEESPRACSTGSPPASPPRAPPGRERERALRGDGTEGIGSVYPTLKQLHADEGVFSYRGVRRHGRDRPLRAWQEDRCARDREADHVKLPPPFNQVPNLGIYHQIHHKFVICGFNGPDPVVYCGSSNLALEGEAKTATT